MTEYLAALLSVKKQLHTKNQLPIYVYVKWERVHCFIYAYSALSNLATLL